MEIVIDRLDGPAADQTPLEIVERKGLGHPDSICDALAEQFSLSLCRFYQDRFGLVLHHNVDKALLWGGRADPRFGGGEVVKPIEIFIAGRATDEFRGVKVPLADLLVAGSQRWLREHIHALDPDRHVRFHTLVRPGSADLVELYLRQQRTGVWLSNDTSLGVGFAPLSELETIVYEAEQRLTAPDVKAANPEIGEDVKIMGVRRADQIRLTVGCAFVSRHVANIDDYRRKKARVAEIVRETAAHFSSRAIEVDVNVADDPEAGSVYLTVTGTSAEAGDDGEAGRGNRANGLITPYRPMTMESVAGKNPVTHVGKLYNLVAGLIAAALVEEIAEIHEAQCFLVSQIGRPIKDPQVVDVRVRPVDGVPVREVEARVRGIVESHLGRLDRLWEEILGGRLGFDRWPLAIPAAMPPVGEATLAEQRAAMVRQIEAEARATADLVGKAAFDLRVLSAMRRVPRHEFVPPPEMPLAYYNGPLPIGHGQTISQPYMVALMTDLLEVDESAVVLEVGAGSGYQAAILAELVKRVYTIEIVEALAAQAEKRLARLGYSNVEVRAGDGYEGWPEHAPYDGIVVTAATKTIPPPLIEQLKPGGRLVIPVGRDVFGQDLVLVEKGATGEIHERVVLPVAFVPLTRRRHESPSRSFWKRLTREDSDDA